MIEVNNLEDLYDLVTNQVREGYFNLVFKPADELTNSEDNEKEIAKDISAFANSNGGIIIYGIKGYNQPDKEHFQEFIDPIDGFNFSKEWLEKVISCNVFPCIEDIVIQAIYLNSLNKDVIYVVIVNKSITVHQASDYRYYKRCNSESVPMYDFEIRALMSLKNTLKIKLDCEIEHSEIKPMFPDLFLSNDQQKHNKKKEKINALYVYGSDIDEYMQIMLSVI